MYSKGYMSNITRLEFLEVKPLLLSIQGAVSYPKNHQDIDTYQQEVRHVLKVNGISNKADVYACQVAIYGDIYNFTTWEEINEYYTMDFEQNRIQFYPLLGDAQCMCGQVCTHRFRVQFNNRYMHVGSICINKDEIISGSFKRYRNKVKPIFKLNKQYYRYVMYQAFNRFKFNNSKITLLKYRDKIAHRSLYFAFQKLKMKYIVKPIVKGMCGTCAKPCGKYPRCSPCEVEHKKTLPFTCKCGVKSRFKSCFKCKRGISLVIIT